MLGPTYQVTPVGVHAWTEALRLATGLPQTPGVTQQCLSGGCWLPPCELHLPPTSVATGTAPCMRRSHTHCVQSSPSSFWPGLLSPRPFHNPGLISQASAPSDLYLGWGMGPPCVCVSVQSLRSQ